MSRLLYRWGRWSATRPWIAIGAWVLLSVLVVAASAGFGKQLDDSMAAPGTDSQAAADLLAGADSGAGGLTAYVVATSSQDGETFVDSRQARVDLDRLESAVGDLPKVLGTTEEVSPDGRVALVRVQYPEIGELAVSDLARAQGRPGGVEGVVVAAARSGRRPLLQLRAAARQRGRGDRPGGRGADPVGGLRVAAGRGAAARGGAVRAAGGRQL